MRSEPQVLIKVSRLALVLLGTVAMAGCPSARDMATTPDGGEGGSGGAGGRHTGGAGGSAAGGAGGQAGQTAGGASGSGGAAGQASGGAGGAGGQPTGGAGGSAATGGAGGMGGAAGQHTGGTGGAGGMGGAGGQHTGGTVGTGGMVATGGTVGTGGAAGQPGTGGAAGQGGGLMAFQTLSLLAGQLGGPGNINGVGTAARFSTPEGIAIDPSGNAFIADTGNHVIRRVVLATGAVSTIAGSPGVSGNADGAGSVARFNEPWGLAISSSGGFSTLYITDLGNNEIRQLNVSTNQVTTLAGSTTSGSTDGNGTAARFSQPRAIAFDSTSNNLYVADSLNNTIRQIVTGTNAVTTIAGTAGTSGLMDGTGAAARFQLPDDLALDGLGNLYIADGNNSAVRKLVLGSNVVTTLAHGGMIVGGPLGIAYDNGAIYATTASSPGALVSVDAVSGVVAAVASLSSSGIIRFDGNGNLYLDANDEVDHVDLAAKKVTAVAGLQQHLDVGGTSGLLAFPSVMAGNGADALFVNQGTSYVVQQVSVSTGTVATLSGASCLGSFTGLANVRSTSLTAACQSSNTIISVPLAGGSSSTVAGSDFVAGNSDGTGSAALFNAPMGLCDDGAGTVFVADSVNQTIRQVVVSSGVVTTLAGMAGTAGSADGSGTMATFSKPVALACDGKGDIFVADAGNHTVRQIVIATKKVITVAGTPGASGTTDGTGAAARFVGPTSLAADSLGNFYVSDGNTVRQLVLSGGTAAVTTVIGSPGKVGVVLGALPAGLNTPGGMVLLPKGGLAVTDSVENAILVAR